MYHSLHRRMGTKRNTPFVPITPFFLYEQYTGAVSYQVWLGRQKHFPRHHVGGSGRATIAETNRVHSPSTSAHSSLRGQGRQFCSYKPLNSVKDKIFLYQTHTYTFHSSNWRFKLTTTIFCSCRQVLPFLGHSNVPACIAWCLICRFYSFEVFSISVLFSSLCRAQCFLNSFRYNLSQENAKFNFAVVTIT